MKSVFAVLSGCLSVFCGTLFVIMIFHHRIERFAGVIAVLCLIISYWFWENRPNAYHLDRRFTRPRKVKHRYWWVPTKFLQKVLLNRYIQQQRSIPTNGGHKGYAVRCNILDAERELQSL